MSPDLDNRSLSRHSHYASRSQMNKMSVSKIKLSKSIGKIDQRKNSGSKSKVSKNESIRTASHGFKGFTDFLKPWN